MTKKFATTVDVEIGQRIRAARLRIGMSQEKLGEALGITFQQVQKYEKGTNRVAGSRLTGIAHVLHIPPATLLGDDKTPVSEIGATDQETAKIVRICGHLDADQRVQLLKIAMTFRPAGATRVMEAAE